MDDEENILTPALPVDESAASLKDGSIPTTGLGYLLHVRHEARNLASTVVADLDTTQFANNQTVFCPEDALNQVDSELMPSVEWQQEQVDEFEETRLRIIETKDEFRLRSNPISLPKLSKITEWHRFCFGSKEKPGNLPLLSTLCRFHQPDIITMLEYHKSWLHTGFTTEKGRWIFALLAYLDKPVHSDTCALLRELARIFLKQRREVRENATLVNEINLLLSIIARSFDQHDLMECAAKESDVNQCAAEA